MRPLDEVPKRPYLGSAIFYGVLSGLLIVVTWATGGGVVRGVIVGAAFFVIATGWNWWRFRQRIEGRDRR